MTMADHPAELRLLAFVEDELGAADAAAVAGHVEGCAQCRAAVETQRAARTVLRAAPVVMRREVEEMGLSSFGW